MRLTDKLIPFAIPGVKEYSDWPTIPQLYLDKEFVGGCDILMSMHQNGELAKMLESKGVLVAADQ
jgi:monothiol glutaredoxin